MTHRYLFLWWYMMQGTQAGASQFGRDADFDILSESVLGDSDLGASGTGGNMLFRSYSGGSRVGLSVAAMSSPEFSRR